MVIIGIYTVRYSDSKETLTDIVILIDSETAFFICFLIKTKFRQRPDSRYLNSFLRVHPNY